MSKMTVPQELRRALGAQLAALVGGERPDLLTWVDRYGPNGAALVPQPEAIWTHPRSEATPLSDGGWHVVLPLWTADESPNDLSAEFSVAADGTARLEDVHVL